MVKGRDALRAGREGLPPGLCEIGSCNLSIKFALYTKTGSSFKEKYLTI